MNLHSIVGPIIVAVNPPLLCSLQASSGYTTVNFVQQPSYATPVQVFVQCQALSYADLKQLDGLNIQGTKLAMYIQGNWNAAVRSQGKGGDLITTPDGQVWLAVQVLENWSLSAGWTKLAVTLQNGS